MFGKFLCAAGLCAALFAAVPRAGGAALDEFVKSIQADDSLTDVQREEALKTVERMKADDEASADIVVEVLMRLYPEFEEAMGALGDEDGEAALARLEKLADAKDRYLAAESSYFSGRAHMMAEHYEKALPSWEDVLEKHAETTFRTAEAIFFKGMCQSQLLMRKEAIESLDKFLVDFADAPERMQVAAFHELELLKAINDGTLPDVHNRMDFSRRRLAIQDSGERTQEEQDNIIAMLDKLIEEAEQRENQGGGGDGGGEGSGDGSQGGSPGGSSGRSGDGGGGAASGNPNHPLDQAQRGTRTGSRTPWGRVRDADREAQAFAALKKKFPERYKELVEQYYRSLSDENLQE